MSAKPNAEGGWASKPTQRRWNQKWSYKPGDILAPYEFEPFYPVPEPAHAVCDFWTPPHEMSLPPDLCDRVLALRATGRSSGGCDVTIDDVLDPADRSAIISRFEAANELWWQLEVDHWNIRIKKYFPKADYYGMDRHIDLHPGGGAYRKIAGVVQLSNEDEYAGCDLRVFNALTQPTPGAHYVDLPRARGTLLAMPGWTSHWVRDITAGERLSLCINGWGPKLR